MWAKAGMCLEGRGLWAGPGPGQRDHAGSLVQLVKNLNTEHQIKCGALVSSEPCAVTQATQPALIMADYQRGTRATSRTSSGLWVCPAEKWNTTLWGVGGAVKDSTGEGCNQCFRKNTGSTGISNWREQRGDGRKGQKEGGKKESQQAGQSFPACVLVTGSCGICTVSDENLHRRAHTHMHSVAKNFVKSYDKV